MNETRPSDTTQQQRPDPFVATLARVARAVAEREAADRRGTLRVVKGGKAA
jgi:hypothetical protein